MGGWPVHLQHHSGCLWPRTCSRATPLPFRESHRLRDKAQQRGPRSPRKEGGGDGPEPGSTHHESVVRKLVPPLDVLDEVGAAVVGVSPGHRGTDRTNLSTKKQGLRRLTPAPTPTLCGRGLAPLFQGSCPATPVPGQDAPSCAHAHPRKCCPSPRVIWLVKLARGGYRLQPQYRPFLIPCWGQNKVSAIQDTKKT